MITAASPDALSQESTRLLRVGIVGGSGYIGGELARLLLQHPHVRLAQVASEHAAGSYLHALHPNLRPVRGCAPLRLVAPEALESCDALFLALPHGESSQRMARYKSLAPRIIDLSADFRLRDPAAYQQWYGSPHPSPELLSQAVYGIPELRRDTLRGAALVSGAGCIATAAILGLAPLVRAGLLDTDAPLIIDAKIGSSAAGAKPGPGSHHPDRSGAVRSFAPTGHRHTAEIIQELGWPEAIGHNQTSSIRGLYLSATAVELVRGALITAHGFLRQRMTDREIWAVYREAYSAEPFIRVVKERSGTYRYPEPKLLAGTNFCDVGFEIEAQSQRIVVIAALDNLMKGAAGNGVQALNVMMGWDETTGLESLGLRPL